MIEPDLAELVDDHRGVGELGPAQELVQQRGLAAAQEARQHGDGNALFGGGLRVGHRYSVRLRRRARTARLS